MIVCIRIYSDFYDSLESSLIFGKETDFSHQYTHPVPLWHPSICLIALPTASSFSYFLFVFGELPSANRFPSRRLCATQSYAANHDDLFSVFLFFSFHNGIFLILVLSQAYPESPYAPTLCATAVFPYPGHLFRNSCLGSTSLPMGEALFSNCFAIVFCRRPISQPLPRSTPTDFLSSSHTRATLPFGEPFSPRILLILVPTVDPLLLRFFSVL